MFVCARLFVHVCLRTFVCACLFVHALHAGVVPEASTAQRDHLYGGLVSGLMISGNAPLSIYGGACKYVNVTLNTDRTGLGAAARPRRPAVESI